MRGHRNEVYMEEKMQGIRASDLVVGYEGKSVLKDVNFWVRPGQILTLIGPNGSGTSTLSKVSRDN